MLGGLLVISSFLMGPGASALSGSEFRAGSIIDDAIFYNRVTMDSNQVQNFLNSKVPVCDTNGTSRYNSTMTRAQYGASVGNPPPYTCLKNYTQNTPSLPAQSGLCGPMTAGTRTGAQIITDVAMSCGINPQTLLILLQKEQSLVTDDWPFRIQYEKATGFACPDTAPCDSGYAGYFYQVYYAARQFKLYARDANSYNYRAGRNNNILYNPNHSCGSSSVFISNQATAGLYVYTPYQPNQAALNNLYGTGDGCSAYGNRNFWRMFSDWFGGTNFPVAFKSNTNGTVYIQSGGYKFSVPSMGTLQDFAISPSAISTMSQASVDSVPSGTSSGFSNGLSNVVKSSSSDTVYLVSVGKKYAFTDMEQLNQYGFSGGDIAILPDGLVNFFSTGSTLGNFISSPSNNVFKLEANTKRIIFEGSVFAQQNPNGPTTFLSDHLSARIPSSTPIVSRDTLIADNTGSIRLVTEGVTYGIPSLDVFHCWGFNVSQTTPLQRVVVDSYLPNGFSSLLSCDPFIVSGTSYIPNGTSRIPLPSSFNASAYAPTPGQSIVLERLPVDAQSAAGAVKDQRSAAVWYINSDTGTLDPIPTWYDMQLLGFDTNLRSLKYGDLSALPKGDLKLAIGRPIKTTDSAAVFITTGQNIKQAVASADDYTGLGYDWGRLLTLPASQLAQYSAAGTINQYIINKQNNAIYLADPNNCLTIPQVLHSAYGVDQSVLMSTQQYDGSILPIAKIACKNATAYVKSNDSGTVYKLEDGTKKSFGSWQELLADNNNSAPVISVLSPSNIGRFSTR